MQRPHQAELPVEPADCHAVRIRVTDSAAALSRVTGLPGTVWREDVPLAADESASSRRLAAELARPVRDLRCTLLRYRDGQADLVLVAHRAFLDVSALRALVGTTGAHAVVDATGAWTRHTDVVAPDWGLGERAESRCATSWLSLPGTEAGDEASWQAALAVTLGRYSGESDPVLATEHGTVRLTASGTVGDIRGALPRTTDLPAVAGLLFDLDGAPWTEYVPCLAPPFPLTLSVLRGSAGGIMLRIDHWPSHVRPAIAEQFGRHLVHVHDQILRAPDNAEVTLFDRVEQESVVALGRGPALRSHEPRCVHERFEQVAAATPDAIAVSDETHRLTYREVDQWADRLAGGLVAAGVRAGDRVGICLDRTAELVVVMLAVLKAGGVYVPMDPAYPAARLLYTVDDCAPEVVVTTSAELMRQSATATVTPDELVALAGRGRVASGGSPDDPAYVIYTSGSTGRPKGVVVPHRNVTSLVDATRPEFGLGGGDAWTMFHSSAFDFSVWEIWGCLLTGGRLVVVPHAVTRDPEAFRDLLVREEITVLSQTPSAFTQLLEVDHAQLGVRLVVFGGEALDARMLLRWFDRHPETSCRIANMYGITETTVHVTVQFLTRAHALAATRSVGRALPGWHLYVLDTQGRLAAPGVVGEIHVGGAGVADGYLGREELTAQRFVPDPFADGLMYRSGDLGRLRPDGALDHVGRADSQVKVRGFRIELDEVRAVLLAVPEVVAAAVVVRGDAGGDAASTRLDAYVVLSAGDTRLVRRRAAEFLPEHMVPATVTALPALPVTANGKLDQDRLPPPRASIAAEPRSSTVDGGLAGRLAEVWTEVLGVEVGVDDDFFELGGNSLHAVRIVAGMRARGLPVVPLKELYRHPTVRGLVTEVPALLTTAPSHEGESCTAH